MELTGLIGFGAFTPASGGAIATRSLNTDVASSQYLSMSSANFGNINQQKGAVSVWIKRTTAPSAYRMAVGQWLLGDLANSSWGVFVGASGDVYWSLCSGGTEYDLGTNTSTIATGTWYHIYCLYDTTQSTAADRLTMYINGTLITSFAYTSYPTLNANINNPTTGVGIGGSAGGAFLWDGKVYQPGVFSGTNPSIGSVYSAGKVDILGVSGLMSLQNPSVTVTEDDVLAAAWTNNNTATANVDIP